MWPQIQQVPGLRQLQLRNTFCLLGIFILLGACTSIDRKVEGWPQDLVIQEEQVGFWDVQAACWDDMPILLKLLGTITVACTVVDLDKGTCKILRWQDTLSEDIDEHEKKHCKGYAHDDGFQQYFDQWKATRKEKELDHGKSD